MGVGVGAQARPKKGAAGPPLAGCACRGVCVQRGLPQPARGRVLACRHLALSSPASTRHPARRSPASSWARAMPATSPTTRRFSASSWMQVGHEGFLQWRPGGCDRKGEGHVGRQGHAMHRVSVRPGASDPMRPARPLAAHNPAAQCGAPRLHAVPQRIAALRALGCRAPSCSCRLPACLACSRPGAHQQGAGRRQAVHHRLLHVRHPCLAGMRLHRGLRSHPTAASAVADMRADCWGVPGQGLCLALMAPLHTLLAACPAAGSAAASGDLAAVSASTMSGGCLATFFPTDCLVDSLKIKS